MKKQSKSYVAVEFSKEEIPFVNAALFLSLTIEKWCVAATLADMGKVETNTLQWQKTLTVILNKVFNQTKIYDRRFGEAQFLNVEVLSKILETEFKKWEKKRIAQESH